MPNRVVARFADGRVVKGQTADFLPTKPVFHLSQTGAGAPVLEVRVADLKALFFVKDLAGDASYNEGKAFAACFVAMAAVKEVKFL